MHDFHYRGRELFCESVPIREITKKTGTPVFIYSTKTLVDHIKKIQRAFRSVQPIICYSMKANSNLAVLKTLVREGAGLDIVSGGELYRAKKTGCDPKKIVYAGVGKTNREIEEAIRYGILFFNVESVPELKAIERVAIRLRKKANVSLRVNPGVDPQTHDHIATGKAESKFGLEIGTAKKIFLNRNEFPALRFCGIHVHIGSQILSGKPFVEAFWKVLSLIDELEKEGLEIQFLNLGGGLGVIYSDENPQTADEFAKNILPLFKGRRFKLVFEPGRFIAANAGILAAQVLHVKETKLKNFAIIDAAMNDLIRPTLYDAYHEVWPLVKSETASKKNYDIVGPICESGDFLAKDRHLQELREGDHLALMTSGAYGFVMSSNYNSRPRAAEVLVKGKSFFVVRKREIYSSLVNGESTPKFLAKRK
ncbi:MAG: diaminopimelate decarboxylase [Candidatus Omnitrophica bacterium]|nr:diaminopimelate decarboxylase [Candidatus Omnitrophota bacterium]